MVCEAGADSQVIYRWTERPFNRLAGEKVRMVVRAGLMARALPSWKGKSSTVEMKQNNCFLYNG